MSLLLLVILCLRHSNTLSKCRLQGSDPSAAVVNTPYLFSRMSSQLLAALRCSGVRQWHRQGASLAHSEMATPSTSLRRLLATSAGKKDVPVPEEGDAARGGSGPRVLHSPDSILLRFLCFCILPIRFLKPFFIYPACHPRQKPFFLPVLDVAPADANTPSRVIQQRFMTRPRHSRRSLPWEPGVIRSSTQQRASRCRYLLLLAAGLMRNGRESGLHRMLMSLSESI